MTIEIRKASESDIENIAAVIRAAFGRLKEQLDVPMPLAAEGPSVRTAEHHVRDSGYLSLVATTNDSVVGVNFVDARSNIGGIGPLAVVPESQRSGVGRMLMNSADDWVVEQGLAGSRLVTAAANPTTLVLYSQMGFQVRDSFAVMNRKEPLRLETNHTVRAVDVSDLENCNAVCQTVHGFNRSGELLAAIGSGNALLVERDGRVAGYSSGLGSMGHSVGLSNADLFTLLSSGHQLQGRGVLVPIRNTELLNWSLANGFRIEHQTMMMTKGLYSEPAGAYMPSMTC